MVTEQYINTYSTELYASSHATITTSDVMYYKTDPSYFQLTKNSQHDGIRLDKIFSLLSIVSLIQLLFNADELTSLGTVACTGRGDNLVSSLNEVLAIELPGETRFLRRVKSLVEFALDLVCKSSSAN